MEKPPGPAQGNIEDYALIGDCRGAALVSRAGSIDWLCWPRFDSAPTFAALLDPKLGGRFAITPTEPFTTRRAYLYETNVLATEFQTRNGRANLLDFMPVATEEEKRRLLLPDHALLRRVTCEQGEIELTLTCDPRRDWGRRPVKLEQRGALGICCEHGDGLLVLSGSVPLEVRDGQCVGGRLRLRSGQTAAIWLTFAEEAPAVFAPHGTYVEEALERSLRFWRSWAGRARYRGPHRPAVVRSALCLKLLAYAPSGAIVAAPTTSLPERVGGSLNWDYRYCWLRDASFTARALFGLGYHDEGNAFVGWLLHSTRLTHTELAPLYNVYGEAPCHERELPWLSGYRASQPVRVGNVARNQIQLDVYGEVIDAATQFTRKGGSFDFDTERLLVALGEYVCQNWQRPDDGLWESRSGPRHHTYSKVLCWAALDRLLELQQAGHLPRCPRARFAQQRDAIRRAVEARGWSETRQSYTGILDGEGVDAALLRLPAYRFVPADTPRMRKTYARIEAGLGAGNGLLYRYPQGTSGREGDPEGVGDSPGEGAFGICSFWAAEYLAAGGGTLSKAERLFSRVLGYANDVGLFGEEIDPRSGQALGNFPQGFTHVGLINAALAIEARARAKNEQPMGVPRRGRAEEPAARPQEPSP